MRSFFVYALFFCIFSLQLYHFIFVDGRRMQSISADLFSSTPEVTTLPGEESGALNILKTMATLGTMLLLHQTAAHYLIYIVLLVAATALQVNPTLSENLNVFNSFLIVCLWLNPIYFMTIFTKITIWCFKYFHKKLPRLCAFTLALSITIFYFWGRSILRSLSPVAVLLNKLLSDLSGFFSILHDYSFYFFAAYWVKAGLCLLLWNLTKSTITPFIDKYKPVLS